MFNYSYGVNKRIICECVFWYMVILWPNFAKGGSAFEIYPSA